MSKLLMPLRKDLTFDCGIVGPEEKNRRSNNAVTS